LISSKSNTKSYTKDSFDSYKNAVQSHLQTKSQSQTKELVIQSDKCRKDLQKQIQYLLTSVILTKMCLLKYIAEIVNIKHNSICFKEEDLSKQKEAYHILSQEEQDKYKTMFKKNRDDIMFYRDLFASMKIEHKTCEDQKIKVNQYAKELDLVMIDLANISQKLYKTNL
jgi:hypothetical protein